MLNPVLRREIRTTLRNMRTFVIIMLYVLVLAAVSGVYLAALSANAQYGGFSPKSAGYLYILLSGFQLGLIILIVPALAGGGVSAERERQTLDLMLITKMSTFSVIIGKLLSSMLVVTLLIVASMPVFSVMLYYGGVSILHVFEMTVFTLVTAAFVGSVSIFMSAVFKRTVAAMVMTYIIFIILSLGTLFFVLIFNVLTELVFDVWLLGRPGYFWVLSLNPFFGFVSVLDSQTGTTYIVDFINSVLYYDGTSWNGYFFPLWSAYSLISILLSALLLGAAAYKIQPVKSMKSPKEIGGPEGRFRGAKSMKSPKEIGGPEGEKECAK